MEQLLDIDSLAYGGDGIGHLPDGRVAFVAGALPGDKVLMQVIENRDRFVKGRVASIEQASPDRVEAPCAECTSGRCGGCPWGSLDYSAQLTWKRRMVVDALTRISKIDGAVVEQLVADCVPSKRQWHYRNKVEFEVGQDVAGRLTLGMHAAAGAFDPLSTCQLAPEQFEKVPKALTGALRYALGGEDVGLERVGLRVSRRTKDVELALWTRTGRFPRAAVAKILGDALPVKRVGISRVLLKGEAKARKVTGVESLAGHGFWTEQIAGKTMALSAPSFFQVNTAGAERLIELVMEGLQPDGLDMVLDLYSGAGTFTLPLSEAAGNVIAVESYGSSVRDLRRNLERTNLDAEVIGGDVGRELPELGYVDAAVVDPPRSGLAKEAIEGLMATRARRLAYVSCDPTTLARDLKTLMIGDTYRIASVTPVDLFPQTYHVETVCILERGDR